MTCQGHSQRVSHKVQVIDQETYEEIQQKKNLSQNVAGTTIRNIKYQKSHSRANGTAATFDLMQYVKLRSKQQKKHRKFRRPVVKTKVKKHRVIRREGALKKHTRLKKLILRYRQQRLQTLQQRQEIPDTSVEEISEGLKALSLPATIPAVSQPVEVVDNLHSTTNCSTASPENGNSGVLHSRRFRSYCDNCTTARLATNTEQLLRELNRFQKRAHAENEIKAQAHRRLIVGLREVKSFMVVNKVKMVIIATDCEECTEKNGLDDTIECIKADCRTANIPCVFALRRRQLSYALFKRVPVSCVGILNYEGAQEMFNELVAALQQAREFYVTASAAYATEGKVFNHQNNSKNI